MRVKVETYGNCKKMKSSIVWRAGIESTTKKRTRCSAEHKSAVGLWGMRLRGSSGRVARRIGMGENAGGVVVYDEQLSSVGRAAAEERRHACRQRW
jgi:hypothetical protein